MTQHLNQHFEEYGLQYVKTLTFNACHSSHQIREFLHNTAKK